MNELETSAITMLVVRESIQTFVLYRLCICINSFQIAYLLHRSEFTSSFSVAAPGEGLCANVNDLQGPMHDIFTELRTLDSRVEATYCVEPCACVVSPVLVW